MEEYLFEVTNWEGKMGKVNIEAENETLAWVAVSLQEGKEAMNIKLVGFRWKGITAGIKH